MDREALALHRRYVLADRDYRRKFGRVTVGLRPDPTGAQTVLTVWWFIYGDPVGPYTFRHFVNGKPVGGLQPAKKDNNLHTALHRSADNGKTIHWRFGDLPLPGHPLRSR